jgi:3'-phosphoadenosine 5'-phosphosulfate sulfotransferase (PAPS reductase)/FAD synthetase
VAVSSYPSPPVDLPTFVKQSAIEHVLCSFSGGKDSLVATHLTHELLKDCGIPIEVVFVDTGVGLPAVRRYVEDVAELCGWKLKVLTPREDFFELASRWGMPTPKRRWCCRLLKLEPLLEYVARLDKRRVLFTTGLRRNESRRRAKLRGLYRRRLYRRCVSVSVFYVDPIVDWSDEDVERYIVENGLPVNPAYELIGFSGECFCGAFTRLEHLIEVARRYPEFIERFGALEEAWRIGKFREKNYKVFYAEGLKLSVNDLLKLAQQHTISLNSIPSRNSYNNEALD